jgi:PAS domain S-box-containing protein
MGANPLAAINSVALAIGHFSCLEEMLDYALGKVLEVVQTEAGSVYLLDERRAELTLAVHRGLSEEATRDFDHLKLGEGLSGRVAMTGETIVLRNLKDDPRLTRMAARSEGFQAFASVPLRSNFKTYGTLNVHSRADRPFSEEEVQLLTSMASQIGLAVANTRLYLELEASERKFRGLVESAEDLIYLTDRDGRITYANCAWERVLGYRPSELQATDSRILWVIHPTDRDEVSAAFSKTLAGQMGSALEFRMLAAGGARYRWVSQTGVPLRDETGRISGIQFIAHDITERRALQEQMARAERLADLGRMAANIAHEIRNPLGAIVNSITVLGRHGLPGDQRLFDIVTEEADRLNGIISEFLMFARPPAQVAISCDLPELLEDTVELFTQGRRVQNAAEIRLARPLPAVRVLADPNQMRQVLWNLLANAVEAMPAGGAVDVAAAVAEDGRSATIAVTDDGPGLVDATNIFEPFYTTKAQGTGLGLAVVARIVRDHGGSVTATNAVGRGACFTISMQRAEQPVSTS